MTKLELCYEKTGDGLYVIPDISSCNSLVVSREFLSKKKCELDRFSLGKKLASSNKVITKIAEIDIKALPKDEQATYADCSYVQGYVLTLDNGVVSNNIMYSALEPIESLQGEANWELTCDNGDGADLLVDIISNGIERLVSKAKLSGLEYAPITDVFTISSGGTTPKVASELELYQYDNMLIDRTHVVNNRFISGSVETTAHKDDVSRSKAIIGLEGAILIASEANSPKMCCETAFVVEDIAKTVYVANKVFILQFKDDISTAYRNQLYEFLADGENIRRQLQFYPSKGRMAVSVNSFKRLFVPVYDKKKPSSDMIGKFERAQQLLVVQADLREKLADVKLEIDSL